MLLGSPMHCGIWQISRLQAGASRLDGTWFTHIGHGVQQAQGLVQLSQLLVSIHRGHTHSLCAAQPSMLE